MKMCQSHWNALKQAIEDRGMMHLVAEDGQEAISSIVRELQGEPSRDDFDPLMGSYFRILEEVIKIRGLTYMLADAPYGGCALCEPDEVRPDWSNNWIQGVADEALWNARDQGFVKYEGDDWPKGFGPKREV